MINYEILLSGLNGNNSSDYYTIEFNRWLFDNSDEVILNGEVLTKADKFRIKVAFYNIQPPPNEIIMSGLINGSELTEIRFLEQEIKRIENLSNLLSLKKEYNRQDYLDFLYSKKIELQPLLPNTKTPNIDIFLNEIRTLDVKQKPIKADKNNLDLKNTGLPEHLYGKDIQVCDLRHYSQFTSDYKGTLDKLKVSALNEFKNLSEPKKLSNLNAVKTLAGNITKSWDYYLSIKNEKGGNLLSAINNRLSDIFIIPNKHNYGRIYDNFSTDLSDAILFKEMVLSEFIKEAEPLTIEVGADSPEVDKDERYDSGKFNGYTFKLFLYILDCYDTKGIVKYINIWYFLKRNIDKEKHKNIMFVFTQDDYKFYVKKHFGVEIKKFAKAGYKYEDNEVGILKNISDDYIKTLK